MTQPTWTGPRQDPKGYLRPAVTTCCGSAVVGLIDPVPYYQILTGEVLAVRDPRCYRCNKPLSPPVDRQGQKLPDTKDATIQAALNLEE